MATRCTDETCVNFAHGYQLPYNPSAPGNYTLPGSDEPLDFGVTPSYLNESRDGPAKAAILVVFVISLIFCGARIYARAFTPAPGFGYDDGILLLTAALYIAFVGLAIECLDLGEGRHILWIVLQGMIDVSVVARQETMDFAVHLVYNTALFCCRLSAIAFYQRFAALKWLCYAGYAVITAFYLPQMFTLIFHCDPVTALWPYDFQVEASKYTCLSWGLVYLINGCLSVASDLVIFVIPAVLISRYRAPTSTKLKLALILFPGVLVIGVSAARLGILSKGIYFSDQSWYYGPMLGLEGAEIGGTMMCISVPALKVFGDRALSRSRKAKPAVSDDEATISAPTGFSAGVTVKADSGYEDYHQEKSGVDVSTTASRT